MGVRASTAQADLIGLEPQALQELVGRAGVPDRQRRMRASQLWNWLYVRGATGFDEMTPLPKDLRRRLGEIVSFERPTLVREQVSGDGTIKWLLRLRGGQEVETVFIPEADRGAVCVSTQVGCSLTCSFCHTGTMPLVRNLTAGEILAQILIARDRLAEWPAPAKRRLSHIVVMGM
ncbi:MAG: 23S rRNA (adenine(2503)-C(2))-methyltransferase RlmN, partial [Geminicoccaceae bacterium]|nr:23S rRNA (adenine(2503)-C(2))-methyltransferase RlmN [Geminicoccaceae bacterium]